MEEGIAGQLDIGGHLEGALLGIVGSFEVGGGQWRGCWTPLDTHCRKVFGEENILVAFSSPHKKMGMKDNT